METNNEKNMFGFDEYTYNLLIDFFRSKPSIKIARIYGSRVLGKNRKSSDIDMIIEGTFPDFMLEVFTEEVNSLKHPYRIDFASVSSEDKLDETFIARNFPSSEYFYKAKDFYPLDKYEEQGCPNPILDFDNTRWKLRFSGNFNKKFEDFLLLLKDYVAQLEGDEYDIRFQITFFEKFKGLFEGAWKTLKDYYKEKGEKILLPRQLLLRAFQDNIVSDFGVWNNMIYDFNIMTDEEVMTIDDEIFYRIKTKYMPAMLELNQYFKSLEEK